jgi:limonene 1,2-monooxygenase
MAVMDWPLKFGIFMAPFHPTGQNPTAALERDLDLVVLLDKLGYDEAWIGEHHSAGYEIIASPELFIATAAERTRHIRFGTGVVSLPYHHPFMVAQRIIQLDHITRGRVMLGCGPGSLPSDAFMLGIDPATQRDRMEEALGVILELFRSDEPVTHESDWFTLKDARLHLKPYSDPHPEVAVAAMISPSGPRAAGKHGVSMLSIGATQKAGIDLLGQHWSVMEERSEEFGTVPDRRNWRLVSQVHIAETKEQAYKDVEYGLEEYIEYFRKVAALPMIPEGTSDHPAELMNATGAGVVGTPDDLGDFIDHLIEMSDGGFGTFLVQAHEWANPAATQRSYELIAQHLMGRFQGSARRPTEQRDWAAANRQEFMGAAGGAIMSQFQKHSEEKAAKQATAAAAPAE